jgi:hypothetical protein
MTTDLNALRSELRAYVGTVGSPVNAIATV